MGFSEEEIKDTLTKKVSKTTSAVPLGGSGEERSPLTKLAELQDILQSPIKEKGTAGEKGRKELMKVLQKVQSKQELMASSRNVKCWQK